MRNKEKPLQTIRKKFHFQSIFSVNLFVMSILCILCTVLLTVFFTQKIAVNSKKNLLDTSQLYLETVVHNTDYLIEDMLHQSIVQLSYSHSILSLATAETFSNRDINIAISDISFAAKYNILIDSVALYYPDQNSVYLSDYTRYTLEDYAGKEMISEYENGKIPMIDIRNNSKITTFFKYDNQYILAFDFPLHGTRRLATLYFFIDMEELSKLVLQDNISGDNIFIYDKEGQPVFEEWQKYPEGFPLEVVPGERDGTNQETWGEYNVFRDSSDVLGWNYVYLIDSDILSFGIMDIMNIFLPVVILILGLAIAGSYTAASMLYRPFKQLIMQVGENKYYQDPDEDIKSDMDYLNLAFSNMEERNQRLMNMMNQVSDDVTTRLFMELFVGDKVTAKEVEDLLKGINSPFKVTAPYAVCVVRIPQELAKDVYGRQHVKKELNFFMEEYRKRENLIYHIVYAGGQTYGIVISSDGSESGLTMKRSIIILKDEIGRYMRQKNIDVSFSAGNIYQSIEDLSFSYSEAYKAALEKTLDQEFFEKNMGYPYKQEQVKIIGTDNLDLRIHQILQLVKEGNLQAGEALLDRVMQEGMEVCMNKERKQEYYVQFFSVLSDELVQISSVNMAVFPKEILNVNKKQLLEWEEEELQIQFLTRGKEILRILAKGLKRNKNHFFIAAKEYVQEHYSDSTLSLNIIAEAVGANPSYISRLFKEILGCSFTQFLTDCRMEASLKLLKDKNVTIKDVAALSGFNTIQNYMRLFKKYYGKTPSQYRKEQTERSHI